jgi:hypothetical protein
VEAGLLLVVIGVLGILCIGVLIALAVWLVRRTQTHAPAGEHVKRSTSPQ